LYLMLSTAVQGGFGFFFWLVCAHLYSADKIGVASTLISAMTLISYISLLGFNTTFVRFLPTSKQKNENINTGLTLVVFTAALAAILYLALIPAIAAKVYFVRSSLAMSIGFVLLVAAAAINLLTDSVFIAYRAAKYNLIIYTLLSALKLLLPLGVISLGAYGIFLAQGGAALFGLIISICFMAKYFSFKLKPAVHIHILKSVWHFSSGNYIANLLNIAPPMILPLIVINKLGAAAAGYFYLAFMLVNLLYSIAYSVSQSLFAEGSYEEVSIAILLRRSATFLGILIIPASIFLAVVGPLVLRAFGSNYAHAAGTTLSVLAASGPVVALFTLASVRLKIAKHSLAVVLINLVFAATSIGLALTWAKYGTIWIAYAWLIGNLAAALTGFAYMTLRSNSSPKITV
jgi:O-antigen/teichoic acid export membrane protein